MKFLQPTITVDIAVFTIEKDTLEALIITRSKAPFKGSPALPGGFLHEGETTLDAAKRILKEKAGVEGVYLEQLYTFDDRKRDPRGPVFSVTYLALVPPETVVIRETAQTQNPHLIPMAELPSLAFDHDHILSYALDRLRSKIEYTNVIYSLLPKSFTLTELQKKYESILGKPLDKRNFRKKFKELKLIEETGSVSRGGRQRPAKLYRFISRKPAQLRKFF